MDKASPVTDIANRAAEIAGNNIVAIVAVVGCILLALVLHWLFFRVALNTAERANATTARAILRRTRTVARLGAIALAIQLCLSFVSFAPAIHGFLYRTVLVCLVGFAGWLVIIVVNGTIEMSMSRHRVDVEDNLQARKMRTRLRVLRQAITMLIGLITLAGMLMVIPAARNIGVSLFASAGVAGIVVGFAARPVLSNLLAGIQIALTQPIRIDDAVIIEGEWGWIEEITATYVVVKIWDWRRLIVPLTYVIEKPFQNWTRDKASIIGSVIWYLDYSVPVSEMREKHRELVQASEHWNGEVEVLQVIDTTEKTMTLRGLMSAKNSPTAWNLRCEVREKMISWLQENHPQALPKLRADVGGGATQQG